MAQKTATKTSVKHSIPTAGDGEPTKRLSLAERFRSKAKPAVKKVGAKDRPVLKLTPEVEALILAYAPTKELFDVLEARNNREKAEVNSSIWELWVDLLWNKKSKPETPDIQIKDSDSDKLEVTAQYIVQTGSKVKINMPPIAEGEDPSEVFVAALADLGVDKADAATLVEKEIDFTPIWTMDLTGLMYGTFGSKFTKATDSEQEASEKLFIAIQGEDVDGNALDSNGRAQLLSTISEAGWQALAEHVNTKVKYSAQLTDGSGFLDRACDYAHTRDQLSSILSMLKPVSFIQKVKFGVSDDPIKKAERLIEEAASRLGADLGSD